MVIRGIGLECGAEIRVPLERSLVAEVYPALWSHSFPRDGRNSDQQDAYAAAGWLRQSDLDGSLERFLNPSLEARERRIAEIEGWILRSEERRVGKECMCGWVMK